MIACSASVTTSEIIPPAQITSSAKNSVSTTTSEKVGIFIPRMSTLFGQPNMKMKKRAAIAGQMVLVSISEKVRRKEAKIRNDLL